MRGKKTREKKGNVINKSRQDEEGERRPEGEWAMSECREREVLLPSPPLRRWLFRLHYGFFLFFRGVGVGEGAGPLDWRTFFLSPPAPRGHDQVWDVCAPKIVLIQSNFL